MIGSRIKQRRTEMGLSLRQLANTVGLTASFLSQVEREEADPSITSLRQIAAGLQVPIFYFLESDAASVVVRSHQRPKLKLPQPHLEYELLTPRANKNIEMYVATMGPGAASCDEPWGHPGEECLLILSGCMQIEVGTEQYLLGPGDSIFFDATRPHRSVALGDQPLVYVTCITPSSF